MIIINDITVQVSKTEIEAVINKLDGLLINYPTSRKAKAAFSAVIEAYKKLQRKLLTNPKKDKKYSLKLKYHEADWLELTLRLYILKQDNHFVKTFTDKLHEKLA